MDRYDERSVDGGRQLGRNRAGCWRHAHIPRRCVESEQHQRLSRGDGVCLDQPQRFWIRAERQLDRHRSRRRHHRHGRHHQHPTSANYQLHLLHRHRRHPFHERQHRPGRVQSGALLERRERNPRRGDHRKRARQRRDREDGPRLLDAQRREHVQRKGGGPERLALRARPGCLRRCGQHSGQRHGSQFRRPAGPRSLRLPDGAHHPERQRPERGRSVVFERRGAAHRNRRPRIGRGNERSGRAEYSFQRHRDGQRYVWDGWRRHLPHRQRWKRLHRRSGLGRRGAAEQLHAESFREQHAPEQRGDRRRCGRPLRRQRADADHRLARGERQRQPRHGRNPHRHRGYDDLQRRDFRHGCDHALRRRALPDRDQHLLRNVRQHERLDVRERGHTPRGLLAVRRSARALQRRDDGRGHDRRRSFHPRRRRHGHRQYRSPHVGCGGVVFGGHQRDGRGRVRERPRHGRGRPRRSFAGGRGIRDWGRRRRCVRHDRQRRGRRGRGHLRRTAARRHDLRRAGWLELHDQLHRRDRQRRRPHRGGRRGNQRNPRPRPARARHPGGACWASLRSSRCGGKGYWRGEWSHRDANRSQQQVVAPKRTARSDQGSSRDRRIAVLRSRASRHGGPAFRFVLPGFGQRSVVR